MVHMLEAFFGSKTMTCSKVTLLLLCCCALHKGQKFDCALNKGQNMLVVVALHKGLVGAMVSEQGSLAASGGDGDKPPGKDGEDRREKDNPIPDEWEDWEWEDWEEAKEKWREKKYWYWDASSQSWKWRWMTSSMQQNKKREELKRYFQVGPNCTDHERRLINLASMGNSRLMRIGQVFV